MEAKATGDLGADGLAAGDPDVHICCSCPLPRAMAGLQSLTGDSQLNGEAEEKGKMTLGGFSEL